jgi:ABC-type transport system substrate-binding protein
MPSRRFSVAVLATIATLALGTFKESAAQTGPAGEVVIAWHVTIAPTWFDPSSAPPQITPFGTIYAIHDALARPMPNQKIGASLAESWTESPDGLMYEFKLRRGLKFHNGDPLTAEDVKFSFERYKGAGAKELQTRVRQVDAVDPLTVRFRLERPWPDFMTFYGTTATGVGVVVPKKYFTQVGEAGFRKHPIGAGPYKFVSHTPGVEVMLEAYTGYWRRVPNVKKLVMKSVPDVDTRLAMLKTGEADIAVALDGPQGIEVRRDPRLTLVSSRHASIFWLEFADQWDPTMERAAFYAAWQEKKLHGVFMTAAGNSGNAASRVAEFIYSKGSYAYGGYPDIDDLFQQQAGERDVKKREAQLHRIQQLTIDRAMFAPIMDLRALMGVGPKMADHTINLVPMTVWPSYEDMKIKAQ